MRPIHNIRVQQPSITFGYNNHLTFSSTFLLLSKFRHHITIQTQLLWEMNVFSIFLLNWSSRFSSIYNMRSIGFAFRTSKSVSVLFVQAPKYLRSSNTFSGSPFPAFMLPVCNWLKTCSSVFFGIAVESNWFSFSF